MKIAFRTDSSSQIGTGHFMRCLTLADELKKQGAYIRFIGHNLPPHLRDMLNTKQIEYYPLIVDGIPRPAYDLAHSSWLGNSQIQDAQATIQALSDEYLWDWVVVDHYALDERWEKKVRACTKRLMVIDDLADRQHDCDVLLDQNFYMGMQFRYIDKVPAHCQLLLGPNYALLRKEFRLLHKLVKSHMGEVKRMLVFFGGIDADDYTSLVIQALQELDTELYVDVVIGADHPHRNKIKNLCAIHGYVCHIQTPYIAELMMEADLAIGAGGTAIWERCCLGLPTISICVADNQRKQIADAAEAFLLIAPISGENFEDMILTYIRMLLKTPALIKLIANSGLSLVDGRGVVRVAGAMENSNIVIRRATEQDSQQLLEWRNHPKIRAASRNDQPILFEEHQKWFKEVTSGKNRELLIGISRNRPVGVVRFDKDGDAAEISIYLVPEGGFSGQGLNLLIEAEKWLKANRSDIKSIRASVLAGNKASKNLFLRSNYCEYEIYYQKKI